ncbi:MerR family transcriptional regulator [Nocardia cyriacigeorgica]|uniref:MerR family transcriptional regulator n=1 Tax=Nocardia cyriacigeorgica TaxID=135487 RepID=A0A6P1DFI1_9NOCA|nr:MerR family transcriptional regulator [Nocardia cyriacigeorgica]NEW40983.1 MerR family transcriptional regulator [Nocardia cyriacigeorgica]NEW47343.1 MerR family transcriptional regulator [Nocardia cyriacigeorgica]NEW51211.1 MerR family transcriptional regulator [Nocardia cyriacigeorgica]NEW55281.1 MerR family transcriptional regulator [Nocardia cyriacigeorgica]
MRIGELAERAATTTRALRYYESRGLLRVGRDVRGYRVYGEDDYRVVRQIQTLQDCGFELEEIRPFVECLQAGNPSGDSCSASAEVYHRKLAEVDDLIGQLEGVRSWILDRLARPDPRIHAKPPACEFTARGFSANGIGAVRPRISPSQ